jgi:HK97 family phage major capsid protein
VNQLIAGPTASADADGLDSPPGILSTAGIVDGGATGDNLDAITAIEVAGGTASAVIASPGAWGNLAKLKTGSGSAASLFGAETEAAERRLLGLPVYSTAAMPEDTLIVLDASAILTVRGSLMDARSDDAFFGSDVCAVRVLFRSVGDCFGLSSLCR